MWIATTATWELDGQMRLRNEGLSWRQIDQEAVVLDLRSSTYFRTNRSGTVLLKALVDGDQDSTGLVILLQETYGLPPEQADRDVAAFVGQLQERGLLALADE